MKPADPGQRGLHELQEDALNVKSIATIAAIFDDHSNFVQQKFIRAQEILSLPTYEGSQSSRERSGGRTRSFGFDRHTVFAFNAEKDSEDRAKRTFLSSRRFSSIISILLTGHYLRSPWP
jgi:hypothetical protein